jgi:trehalose 6-phosphate phosphatase
VHYPDPDTDQLRGALAQVMDRIAEPDRPLKLIAGHAVFELQLDGFDKGRAIERFMTEHPFTGRRPVFIGDDVIDHPGFQMALGLGGFAFSVGIELPGLSGRFPGPGAVRDWLHELSQ